MVRKTKEESKETYNRLLSAATDLFCEKGGGGTTLEDIAEATGLTRGAVYWHFKNKLALFTALHDQLYSSFMDQIAQRTSEAMDDPLWQLQELTIEVLVDFTDNPQRRKILSIFYLKSDYSGDMVQFLNEQNDKTTETILTVATFFEKAVRRGSLPANTDCFFLSYSLSCYISGLLMEEMRNPSRVDLKTKARPMIEMFFRGLTRPGT